MHLRYEVSERGSLFPECAGHLSVAFGFGDCIRAGFPNLHCLRPRNQSRCGARIDDSRAIGNPRLRLQPGYSDYQGISPA